MEDEDAAIGLDRFGWYERVILRKALDTPAGLWESAMGMKKPARWQFWRQAEWELRVLEAKRQIEEALRIAGN